MNFKSLILLSLSIVTIVGAATQASAADVCKNVSITIENGTNDPIKVTKFEYQDTSAVGQPFRTENLLGIDGKEQLNVGKSFTKKRNLRSIKNELTRFRVTYRHQIGGVKFEDTTTEVTNTFDCHNGIFQKVTLTK
jgi:opacity protein-like surface antigen